MRVLNLYAGVGGNRLLWKDVEVTSVEWDEEIAGLYAERFPDDELIIGDAHEYLLNHYHEYDFIWSSPPCPTHSKIRLCNIKAGKKYPDMRLYQEIIFLNHFCKSKYVIENVQPYYEPLIPARTIERHLFWSNFRIPHYKSTDKPNIEKVIASTTVYGYSLKDKKLNQRKDKILRNQVDPALGLHILNAARNIITKSNTEQTQLF